MLNVVNFQCFRMPRNQNFQDKICFSDPHVIVTLTDFVFLVSKRGLTRFRGLLRETRVGALVEMDPL